MDWDIEILSGVWQMENKLFSLLGKYRELIEARANIKQTKKSNKLETAYLNMLKRKKIKPIQKKRTKLKLNLSSHQVKLNPRNNKRPI